MRRTRAQRAASKQLHLLRGTDALVFTPVRRWSPQWTVTRRGVPLARVTERYIATPRYEVSFLEKCPCGCGNDEDRQWAKIEGRDTVTNAIEHWGG